MSVYFFMRSNIQNILFRTFLFIVTVAGPVACGEDRTEKYRSISEQAFSKQKRDSQRNQPLPVTGAWYRVKKFVDGDTFWIDDSTAAGVKIRLIGIDTPESRNAGKKKKHPMGKEVARYVETLLTGTRLRLELDVQPYDQYGRVLAYVFLEDGTHLNAHLLQKGYAMLYTVPPNVKYADEFYKLHVHAREYGLGIWKGLDR